MNCSLFLNVFSLMTSFVHEGVVLLTVLLLEKKQQSMIKIIFNTVHWKAIILETLLFHILCRFCFVFIFVLKRGLARLENIRLEMACSDAIDQV